MWIRNKTGGYVHLVALIKTGFDAAEASPEHLSGADVPFYLLARGRGDLLRKLEISASDRSKTDTDKLENAKAILSELDN